MSTRASGSGSRLERALEVWLAHVESGSGDDAALLAAHADLRELLEPMLAGRRESASSDRILGDFRLGRELGRGGMGIVHEAWQQSLGRKVALKLLAPALTSDASAIARFHREAAAAARLRHPGIVEIHDVGHEGDVHWFSMTLVEGEPLHVCADRFRAKKAAVEVVAQALDALQHAHAAGLVHRDVKPANILVRPDGAVVLTDFGLARETSSPTVTVEGGFLGTLDYAAPEQIQAQKVDARADVWSTGVVLAELLTAEHPFARETATATLRAILTQEPIGAARLRAIDADLAAIVGRALEKDPAKRYPSAVAFLADLRAWQQGLAVAARLPGAGERIRRWARREPWQATAAVLFLLGVPLLATIGGYLWANAPRIEAAAKAEKAAQREEALTAAWIALNEENYAAGVKALQPWADADDDLEVRYALASLLTWTEPTRAASVLAPFAGSRVHELVSLLMTDGGNVLPFRFEDVEAKTMLECAALGQIAVDQVRVFRRSESFYRHAAKWYGRAIALSPQPRAWLLLQGAITAARADDEQAFQDTMLAFEQHFSGTRGWQLLHVLANNQVPIERGLSLLSGPELATDVRWQLGRAGLLMRAGREEEAIALYEKALATKPDNSRAWEILTRLLLSRKELERALAAAQQAVAADANSGEAIGLVGTVLSAMGRFAEARPMFARAMELEPSDWKHPQNLGLMCHELRDDPAALAAFEKAAALAPTQPGPFACMARTLRRLERFEEAFVAEVRADTVHPAPDWRVALRIATRSLEVGLHHYARQSAERATQLAPEEKAAWWGLAEVLIEAQSPDPAAAASAVDKALAIDPQATPRERAVQGRCEAANGRVDTAILHLEAALGRANEIPRVARQKAEDALRLLRSR